MHILSKVNNSDKIVYKSTANKLRQYLIEGLAYWWYRAPFTINAQQ